VRWCLSWLPFVVACSGTYSIDPSASQNGADGGGSAAAPAGCDLSKEPKDSPACVSDAVGFFVDATKGDDAAAGTREAPFRTISKAVSAVGDKSRVFVCGGSYPESVQITHTSKVYGGFACDTWVYNASIRVDVAPANVGAPLLVNGANDVEIGDLFFRAQPGTPAARGSVAAIVSNSQNVRFVRGGLTAGAGVKGADGTLAAFTFPAAVTTPGGSIGPLPPSPAKGLTVTCPGGATSTGGNGGNGGGAAPTAGLHAGVGGAAGGKPGTAGAGGQVGAPGAALAVVNGALVVKDGTAGGSGGVGGGGGGGTGSTTAAQDTYYGGGAGGVGGCGGAGGGGGGTGGYSIALASIDALVSLDGTVCEAATAGDGGNGATSQAGQPGATGGKAPVVKNNDGGDGGAGGAGGAGGGGAGGVSAAIAWYMGSAPIHTGGVKLTFSSTPAKGGAGGGSGATPNGTSGPMGRSVDVYPIP